MRAAEVLEVAARVATEVLEPAAADVDTDGRLPAGHLDALAAAGLYGVSGPPDAGGLGADRATALRVTEILAAGCLATAFVWVQHQGVVRAVAASTAAGVRDRWLGPLCTGAARSGVGVAGIRPGADPLRAEPDGDGWLLTGAVPWVTGWGLVDVVHVAARSGAGDDADVVWLLVDAADAPTIDVERLDLTAVQASSTVTLTFAGHRVPGDRLTARTTYGEWRTADVGSLRGNGSLALGLALRCAGATDDAEVRARVDEVRAQLDRADDMGADDAREQALADARAAASALAWAAAARLTVATGGRAVLAGDPAGRAGREAAFLLVFGSRPPIRAALQSRLAV